jgi:hypothetical protein
MTFLQNSHIELLELGGTNYMENLGCSDPKAPQHYVVRTFPTAEEYPT